MTQVARAGTPSSLPDSEDNEDIYGALSPVDAPRKVSMPHYTATIPSSIRLSVPGQRPQRDPRVRMSGAPLGSLTENHQPTALNSVLSAPHYGRFESVKQPNHARHHRRGESSRRRSEKKISETSQQVRKPLSSYVDRKRPARISVYQCRPAQGRAEWPFLAHDRFNSVALALSMLDQSSLGASGTSSNRVKQIIETSFKARSTITTSRSPLPSRAQQRIASAQRAQSSVGGARRRLRDSREALGAKRADLVSCGSEVKPSKRR